MKEALEEVGFGAESKREGNIFFSTSEDKEFSFEEIKYFLFKESLIFSSLYYRFPLHLKDYDEVLFSELPIIKGLSSFSKHDEVIDYIYRADSLSHFLKIEYKKGKLLSVSGLEWEIKDIPLPVYLPKKFMRKLKQVVFSLREIGCKDELVEHLEAGYNSFKNIIDIYKGKLYPLLFEYLQSEDTKAQITKRAALIRLYAHTLRLIHNDEHLMLFCESMQIDTILRDMYKKKIEYLVPEGTNIKIKHMEVQELEDYLTINRDTYLTIAGEETLLLPLGLSKNFSLDAGGFYAVSFQDILLHYLPLVQLFKVSDDTQLEEWDASIEIESGDINRFFFYKQSEILGTEKGIEKKEAKVLEVIGINTKEIKSSVERESKKLFNQIKDRVYFLKLNQKEKIFKVLSIIRLSLEKNREMKIKINDTFYANIQDEKLREMVVDIMNDTFSIFLKSEYGENKKNAEGKNDT